MKHVGEGRRIIPRDARNVPIPIRRVRVSPRRDDAK